MVNFHGDRKDRSSEQCTVGSVPSIAYHALAIGPLVRSGAALYIL